MAYSNAAPTTRGKKRLFAKFNSTFKRCIKPSVHAVPAARGTSAKKVKRRSRKVNSKKMKIKATA